MNRLNNAFTRGCTVVERGDPFTEDAAKVFKSEVMNMLNECAGDPKGATFNPGNFTINRMSQKKHDVLARWTQHLAWYIFYKAVPLVENAAAASSSISQPSTTPSATTTTANGHDSELADLQAQLVRCQRELLERQSQVIDLQNQVLSLKDNVIQSSVQTEELKDTEERLYSEICASVQSIRTDIRVHRNESKEALKPNKLRAAMVNANTDRSTNVMVYGLPEKKDCPDLDHVKELFEELGEAAEVEEVKRLGGTVEGKVRPVKLVLRDRDSVRRILRKKTALKDCERWKRVYLAPDLSPEERAERKFAVMEMKDCREMYRAEGKRCYVRGSELFIDDEPAE